MVGDPTVTSNDYHYLYEFIVRDQVTGFNVYRTAYKVHALKEDILVSVREQLRDRVASECLILFNIPVNITELCSVFPADV